MLDASRVVDAGHLHQNFRLRFGGATLLRTFDAVLVGGQATDAALASVVRVIDYDAIVHSWPFRVGGAEAPRWFTV